MAWIEFGKPSGFDSHAITMRYFLIGFLMYAIGSGSLPVVLYVSLSKHFPRNESYSIRADVEEFAVFFRVNSNN